MASGTKYFGIFGVSGGDNERTDDIYRPSFYESITQRPRTPMYSPLPLLLFAFILCRVGTRCRWRVQTDEIKNNSKMLYFLDARRDITRIWRVNVFFFAGTTKCKIENNGYETTQKGLIWRRKFKINSKNFKNSDHCESWGNKRRNK